MNTAEVVKISILLIELSELLVYFISQCKVLLGERNAHDVSSLLKLVKVIVASQQRRQRKKYLSRFVDNLDNKQLLDEVFVISRIIKVEVRVISRSRRLRLITLTETLIILDITKTESNNCFIIH